ncbi:MAG: OsmC family protein [Cyclobacteriaceae bacterium]
MDPHLYSVNLTWSTERKGLMCSPELETSGTSSCIEVATPPQFPKGVPGIWSPEHLFTAAISSCFMTTFLAIAEGSRLNFSSFACKASGKLEMIDGKLMMSEVTLSPEVVVMEAKDGERALRVLQKTEAACLITNSIKSKVIMNPEVTVKANPILN